MAHTTTTVITNQPGAGGTVIMKTSEREWSSGTFACFDDIGSCLAAFCCEPFFECYVANHAGEFCCLPMCVPGASIAVRTKLRTQYGIRGSICNDCLIYAFCTPCVLAQMKREIDNVNQGRA
ncbi:Cornifelin-like B [Holothuria leucospilota]|uniref:Cornifelin-like B n=1 Tax=Holothuria leucospilota TaxID=206669 RepID=A0A9Q1CHP4_HOLLE|nr:Cornifelin-like B [Holothuria leucospilota]